MPRGYVLCSYEMPGNELLDRREFTALPIRIGRNALNDFPVSLSFVSDFHARIEDVDGRISIRDLGSKNGVFMAAGGGGTPKRIPAQTAVDLAPTGYVFFLGPFVRLQVESVELSPGSVRRESKFSGSVIGNVQMLADMSVARKFGGGPVPYAPFPGRPSTEPPPPSLPSLQGVGALPPLDGSVAHTGGMPAMSSPQGYMPNTGAMPTHGGVGKSTQHFGMAPEVLALMGLRELAGSLVPGQQLETTGDVARLITKLHDTIEVFCRCFIPLREGYAQFVSSMDLQRAAMQRSVNRSRAYMEVEMARDPGAVASALLNWRDSSLDAPNAVEGIFADLMVHQVALLDGVMQGVRSLLDELSPENIERAMEGNQRRPLGLNLPIGRYKALWQAYCDQYERLSEEKQAFAQVFGSEFTEAYREYRRRRNESGGNP